MAETMDVEAINRYLQAQLRATGKAKVTAIEAGRWLAAAGLLSEGSRPGVNLRKLLREGGIAGGRQEPPGDPHGSWFIARVGDGVA